MKKTVIKNWDDIALKMSLNLSAKMHDILALSTNACMNGCCTKKANSSCGCICNYCYARKSIENYSSFRENITNNYHLLGEIIPWGELPIIDHLESPFLRFESHGDLFCKNQVVNYFHIAEVNPTVSCALWTKNPWHILDAIKDGYVKPLNLRLIYSYYFIVNCAEDLELAMKRWESIKATYGDLFDSIFIVLGKEFAKENKHLVNCGARSCYNCHRCYDGFNEIIFEVLK